MYESFAGTTLFAMDMIASVDKTYSHCLFIELREITSIHNLFETNVVLSLAPN